MTFDPDEVVMPNTPNRPESRLWATCFADGIREALKARVLRIQQCRGCTVKLAHSKPASDERWLTDENWNHIGSFNWICELFDQDAGKVRNHVLAHHRDIAKEVSDGPKGKTFKAPRRNTTAVQASKAA